MDSKFAFRYATEQDAGLILHFIRELAVYENLLEEVAATEGDIENYELKV